MKVCKQISAEWLKFIHNVKDRIIHQLVKQVLHKIKNNQYLIISEIGFSIRSTPPQRQAYLMGVLYLLPQISKFCALSQNNQHHFKKK